jgi:Phytanoyl-CoA dioxygenase (PhyH)
MSQTLLMRWLRHIFSAPELIRSEAFLKKYDHQYFKDKSIQEELRTKGYAVRSLLDTSAIAHLKSDFEVISRHPESELTEQFWNSGRASSAEVRNMARKSIDQHVKPALESMLLPDSMDLMGGVFVAKPPSNNSTLNPHQDSSHVDEQTFMSVYAWSALDDITLENGPVHIVPGSHLFGNHQRSLNIPWQFQPYIKTLWRYSTPVTMKAGEVLFFDSAAIHCSPDNLSDKMRLGVNFFLKPSIAPFLHYYQEVDSPNNLIEKYEVGIDFYYSEDFMKRPGTHYPFAGEEPYFDLYLNEKRVKALCEAGKKWAHQS